MAQKVMITLIDDTDGSTADETVSFSLDGVDYEIDLTTENAGKLREALAPWVGHARRTGGRRATGRRGRSTRSGSGGAAEVSEGARAHGDTVSGCGRVAREVNAT